MIITLLGQEINVLAQIFGLFGLIFIVWSYQLKRSSFYIMQSVGYLFCLAEGAVCAAFVGMVVTAASIIRNLLMIYWLKKYEKELPLFITLILLGVMVLGCLPFYITGNSVAWYDFIPVVSVSVATLTAIHKNYFVLKGGALAHECAYLFYQLNVGAYVGVIRQIILAVGIIISIVRMACAKNNGVKNE